LLQQVSLEWDNVTDHLKHGKSRRKKIEALGIAADKLSSKQRQSAFAKLAKKVVEAFK
jgi:hypothetical protein